MATSHYQQSLREAGDFLLGRGIDPETAKRFRLGYVAEPYSEIHKGYNGRLAIPYLTISGVVNIRFRQLKYPSEEKYLAPKGSKSWLYNTAALLHSPAVVVVTEGELDTIVCESYGGIPAVGIAGVNAWKPEFTRCFESAETVLVAGDGDEAGAEMVERLTDTLTNALPAQMPPGHDINSFYLEYGAEALTDFLLGKL